MALVDELGLTHLWQWILAGVHLALALACSSHAILWKRDSRAAVGWVGVIWLVPGGSLFYLLFGINRIRRRAQRLRSAAQLAPPSRPASLAGPLVLARVLGTGFESLLPLAQLGDTATRRPVLDGNRFTVLDGGPAAYAAMLAAIDESRASVTLASYIMNWDEVGRAFVAALGAAVARGVEVRVLVDAVGARYSRPSILGELARARVPYARFLPSRAPWRLPYMNLRNHRKVLVVDGRIGFTGGANIREETSYDGGRRRAVHDLHFRIDGPVVQHLQEVFADDWQFTTRESLAGPPFFVDLAPVGEVAARGISDGPDEDHDKLRLVILGALACARRSVRILTPYFLPDQGLITAVTTCALRGVEVDVVIPERGNLRPVQWASTAMLWQVLERGVRVWASPMPFDHSKLMIVDDAWALVGSANWDPRSLRLNFELCVECYGERFAAECTALVEARRARSRPVTLSAVDARPLWMRLRDGTARLFQPYL